MEKKKKEMLSEKSHFHFLIGIVAILAMETLSTSLGEALEGCQKTCGNLTIPYPFGTKEGCYPDPAFLITCNTTISPPKPFLRTSDIEVTNISIDEGEITILSKLALECYYQNGLKKFDYTPSLELSYFNISNRRNKFTVVGCDTYADITGHQGKTTYRSGCTASCDTTDNVISGSCTGVGCCQTSLPAGVGSYEVSMFSYHNYTLVTDIGSCGYAFLVEEDMYNFSVADLSGLYDIEKLPIVLDWTIGDQCQATNGSKTNICGINSKCVDSNNGSGYNCNCNDGYQGNPYSTSGCTDINECQDSSLNQCDIDGHGKCSNTAGSYTCSCDQGYQGDGRKNGQGCMRIVDQLLGIKIVVGIVTSGTSLLVAFAWVYLVWKKRKLIMLKEKFFKRNGGMLLKEKQKYKEVIKIYTAEELEKATDFYAERNIIGKGGYGVVYKGVILYQNKNNGVYESKEVAVKKSKIGDTDHASQMEEFINEVIMLSQISHKNVVELLGCCLETPVPLLVYEFIPKGSLYDNIHHRNITSPITWDISMRIASETAELLSYLHSSIAVPIIHRDIKSANILLDDNYKAKVCDFGASRMVPQDETQLVTVIQGTRGYLDPEYLQTTELTEKSDVYSFGVVLVEMLTKRKVICFQNPEKAINLANYFVSSLEEGRLFQILDARIVRDACPDKLVIIADLAKRCLSVKGKDRPSMKDVCFELEGLRPKTKHPRASDDNEDPKIFFSCSIETTQNHIL